MPSPPPPPHRLELVRSQLRGSRWAKRLCLAAVAVATLVAALGPAASSAAAFAPATSTATVNLGQASSYAVLSGASVGNTVNAAGAPFTTLRGDLGVSANTQPTGFPPGVVTGTTRVGSAADPAGSNLTAAQAQTDLVTAYNEVAGRTGGAALPAGDLIGQTVGPGLHSSAGAVSNTGTLTLDAGGDSNAVFVFQVGGALNMAAGAQVKLTGGAQASHVFWQVNGAAAIGAGAKFAGTLMSLNAIAVGAGTVFNGRALAIGGAISLDSDDFYSAPPVVTIDNGATEDTNTPTPTISGTTDLQAPGVVTVTVDGQTLTATPSAGTWSVSPTQMANGTYPVVASATDGAGNQTSATQQLTIDTTPPLLTIDGGPSVTTKDSTPTISGTTDAATGTTVDVAVDSQTLTALVQSGGVWNVRPAALTPDGSRTVTASVTDPAGNETTETQTLTVDTTDPAVSIDGGTNNLTNDPTPTISGTAAVAANTPVTVTLADQTLTGLVQSNGTWSVNAASLSDGTHRVVMTVSDEAGNEGTATQELTVDTVAPVVAITGGANASTTQLAPTIAGTSTAAPGTTVTVTIAGQTMTTLLQGNGSWNTTANPVGVGTWQVVASTPDPAGNVGSATQSLTITAASSSGAPGQAGAPGAAGSTGSTGSSGSSGSSGSTGGTGSKGGTGSTGTTGLTGDTSSHSRMKVTLSGTKYKLAHGKRLALHFVISAPAKVTLTVMRGKTLIAKLTTTARKTGRVTLTWNGKFKRKVAAKGTYKIIVRAVPKSGPAATDTASMRVT